MDMEALMRVDTTTLKHPLAAGGEAHYRYRTGDTTTINLGDRTIRLIELKVIPRRRDFHLITGSFWIDADTHSVVQVTFRLAKDFDLERDSDEEDERRTARRMPGFLKPIRADLEYVTMEYGLMHLRWWMPRLVAVEGYFQMGSLRTPLEYERSYSEYDVEGDTIPTFIARDSLARLPRGGGVDNRPCRPRTEMNISVGTADDDRGSAGSASVDASRATAASSSSGRFDHWADTARGAAGARKDCAKLYNVTVADSTKLERGGATRIDHQSGEVYGG
jgi:hypothetical protein